MFTQKMFTQQIFAQKNYHTKKFCKKKFFTESVRLSFVDLRWAQLYVSLVCFVNTSNVFYFDGNIPLELRTKWPWDSLTFTRRMKQSICKFEKTANHCFLSDPTLFIALSCQSSLCVYPHCKVSIGGYTKMCTSPLIFLQLNNHDKYLKKIFDHFHFHCIFDHLSHEQS